MVLERKEVKEKDKWNVEALYADLSAWEKDFAHLAEEKQEGVRYPTIKSFKGKLQNDSSTLLALIKEVFRIERLLTKLYTYAHLRHDEDVTNDQFKNAYDRITLLYHEFSQEVSWIDPEILQMPKEKFEAYLIDPLLEEYWIYLKKIFVLKPYTLEMKQEQMLALSSQALQCPERAFGVLNNADLSFPKIADGKGAEKELTHGTYALYLQSNDRELRKNAFEGIHGSYLKFENTLSELINGQVQKHLFISRARNYPSCLHAALTVHQVDTKVYHNLIDTVRSNISVLHRYMTLRRERLKVDKLQPYDLHVSLVPQFERRYSYEEAEKMVIESVAPLGEEYQTILRKGLTEDRWVDRFENARKRSGAYSSGCYDSYPFILMNFQGTLRDLMTLTHEAGHSMHSYYSRHGQPYHYASYPIFVAEVASTFNEELLFRYLLERAKTPEEKAYLINQKIDDIRSTLFRQTQFAEFELTLHEMAEAGIPMNPSTIKAAYAELNQDYYGPALEKAELTSVECLRIPHFYYNFYVYQYATGISAAYALVEHLLKNGDKARKDYLQFLSSGSSDYPIELLKVAGVDMRESSPIQVLIDRFAALVDELDMLK